MFVCVSESVFVRLHNFFYTYTKHRYIMENNTYFFLSKGLQFGLKW